MSLAAGECRECKLLGAQTSLLSAVGTQVPPEPVRAHLEHCLGQGGRGVRGWRGVGSGRSQDAVLQPGQDGPDPVRGRQPSVGCRGLTAHLSELTRVYPAQQATVFWYGTGLRRRPADWQPAESALGPATRCCCACQKCGRLLRGAKIAAASPAVSQLCCDSACQSGGYPQLNPHELLKLRTQRAGSAAVQL